MHRVVLLFSLALFALACEEARRPGGGGGGGGQVRSDSGASSPDVRDGSPDALGAPDAATADAEPRDADPRDADPPDVRFDATPAPDVDPPDAGSRDATSPRPDAGSTAALTTVADLRAGAYPFGALVRVEDVAVTAFRDEASRPDTLWVQDPRSAANGGLKVFIRASHSATRGARVDVTGTLTDYFGELELNDAQIVVRSIAPEPAPLRLTAAQASQELYEGVLVELVDVTSINPTYSCAGDDPTCMDPRLWELNGPGGIIAYSFVYESGEWDVHSGASVIRGVMTWRYNRRRIMPRTSLDFSP